MSFPNKIGLVITIVSLLLMGYNPVAYAYGMHVVAKMIQGQNVLNQATGSEPIWGLIWLTMTMLQFAFIFWLIVSTISNQLSSKKEVIYGLKKRPYRVR